MLSKILYSLIIFLFPLLLAKSQDINKYPRVPYIVSSISMYDFGTNPSKILYNERNSIAISYIPSAFGLSELNQNSISATYGDSSFVHLAQISGNFSNLFTASALSYSVAYRLFDRFIPSVTANYSYLRIKDYNGYGKLTFDISGILELDHNLMFGFSITNILNGSYESNPDMARQSALFGVEYSLSDDFKLHAGTEIMLESSSGVVLGFIKEFDNMLKVGLAYLTEPEMIEVNLAVKSLSRLKIIYGLNYHSHLGATNQFGLEYQFD